MVTADPARTPSAVLFLKPDFFGAAGGASTAAGSAWVHGTIAPEINTTWLGLAGPGVQNQHLDSGTWADETDIRPTLLFLTGLRDSYREDGRVLLEALDPRLLGTSRPAFFGVSMAYKRINAPVGDLGMKSLAAATAASAADSGYHDYLGRSAALSAERDRLAGQMSALLDTATFGATPIDPARATALVEQADALLGRNI
jgi:hypothetical protein